MVGLLRRGWYPWKCLPEYLRTIGLRAWWRTFSGSWHEGME